MLKRIPSLALWIILGCAVAAVPLACSSSDDGTQDSGANGDGAPIATTRN